MYIVIVYDDNKNSHSSLQSNELTHCSINKNTSYEGVENTSFLNHMKKLEETEGFEIRRAEKITAATHRTGIP